MDIGFFIFEIRKFVNGLNLLCELCGRITGIIACLQNYSHDSGKF